MAIAGVSHLVAQSGNEEEIFELSPFTVDASSDSGYRATSTLAGTRIKTDLKDLAASISVYTSEFMKDVGAVDATELLTYTLNSETGGTQGNFSGASDVDDSRFIQTDSRVSPQGNQRIRGLGKASLTRGYFLTDIGFDTYNTERVTVNRGPNSLLFGIGDPGGVINNGLKQAAIGSEVTNVSFQIASWGSYRTTIDLNRTLIEDRLAIRLAGMFDDQRYKQDPAFERDKRIYGALEAILFTNERSEVLDKTRLRMNMEAGSVDGSPPDVIPPSVAYTNWFEPFDPANRQFTGVDIPANVIHPDQGGKWKFQETYNPFEVGKEGQIFTNVHPSIFRHIGLVYSDASSPTPSMGIPDSDIDGFMGLAVWRTNIDTYGSAGLAGTPGAIAAGKGADDKLDRWTHYHTNSPYGEAWTVGFAVPTLQNTDVFDYRNNVFSGGMDRIERRFDSVNFALDQTFFNGALGFEIAYDKQDCSTKQDFFFPGGGGTSTSGPYDVYIDVAEYLLNGEANPNLGRAYMRVARPFIKDNLSERETVRATVYGELDFGLRYDGWLSKLGKHRFTGLANDYRRDRSSTVWSESWDSDTENIAQIQSDVQWDSARRWLNTIVYLTDESLLGVQSMDDIRLNQINIKRPQVGAPQRILFANPFATGGIEDPTLRGVDTGDFRVVRYRWSESISRQEVESQAVSWQSYFFDGKVVGLLGWRKDDTDDYDLATEAELGFKREFTNGEWNPEATRLAADPVLSESGETTGVF